MQLRDTGEHPFERAKALTGFATLVVALTVAGGLARAEPTSSNSSEGGSAGSSTTSSAVAVAQDSPRMSLRRYLDLARDERFDEAAKYLQVPADQASRSAELAERLRLVLDRNLLFDMERLSPESHGKLDDGLPRHVEDIASLAGAKGATEPVRMVRIEDADGGRWVFSQATVKRVDGWYDGLRDRWIRSHLPAVLLRPGPRELLWWQWLALPLLFGVAWVVGMVLGWFSRLLLGIVFSRTATKWDDILLEKMKGPLTLVWCMAAVFILLPWLSLYEPAEVFIHRLLRASFFLALFWALLRAVDVAAQFLATSPWGAAHHAVGAFIPLGVRIGKVVVAAMAVIAVLSELGFPVASLIAGLGIGGLALALAAQKTVENLFGSVSLGVDQPIRVGDFVKIEDFVGTVESIGLRSTRIRTLDRTVISLPNGKLADMRLETFAPRDRIRFIAIIGLVYGTTEVQMRTVVKRFEDLLRAHPKVWQEAIRVVFTQFGQSSLDLECLCWFETADYNEFSYLRQDVLLSLMKIVEEEGTSFSFPTRTYQLVQSQPDGVVGAPSPEAVPQKT